MRGLLIAALVMTLGLAAHQMVTGRPPEPWPPRVGQMYPDLVLLDTRGQMVTLSSFKGKILLIEPIAFSCAGCNAFVGGNETGRGGFQGVTPQKGLDSIASYIRRYAPRTSIDDPNLVVVQLLLYDMKLKPPTPEDARAWAKHFDIDSKPNHVVLIGDKSFINEESYNMIPGFQLVDENFVLRADSTGHQPTHDLYKELIPMLGDLVKAAGLREARTPQNQPARPARLGSQPDTTAQSSPGSDGSKYPTPPQAPNTDRNAPPPTLADAPAFADESLIEQAYASIPHDRTVYHPGSSSVPETERQYLKLAFHITEQATVLRVSALNRYLRYAPKESIELDRMKELIDFLKRVPSPPALQKFHDHLVGALSDQREFFVMWSRDGFGFVHSDILRLPEHPLVQSASGHLRLGFQGLLESFPRENKFNKQAFYDYLCALDFI